MNKTPPTALVVCLCGSVRFKKEFLEAAQKLEFEGRIVVMPNVLSKAYGIQLTAEQRELLVDIHNQKLKMCDEVYVVDAPGDNGEPYIGDSTKTEIAYAQQLKKPIRYLSKEDS